MAPYRKWSIGLLWLTFCASVLALTPPDPAEVEQLKATGQLQARAEQARRIGNHQADPQSIPRLRWLIDRAAGKVPFNAPPPNWAGGLPTTGNPRVLVLLVDFAEYPADSTNTQAFVSERMFGSANPSSGLYPYESIRAFYQRSSYGALNIDGYVAPWYRAQHPRSYYEAQGSYTALINEALTSLQNAGHNFAQYDNNADGYFDTLYIKWTGPDNGWANFWWAKQTYYSGSLVLNGVRPRKIIWSWIARGSSDYRPQVDIHETGHALGLPDYYDYWDPIGPRGGVGGLDMMDGNWGDHNAFSKMVLGWLTPAVVTSGTQTRNMLPTGSNADAVMVMPNANSGSPFSEYFIAQYRKRGVGNDPLNYPGDGITLWHVDATLNAGGTDYLFDNSYAAHKLLRLIQADGLEQIETFAATADPGDLYSAGRQFTPTSIPNSSRYNGTATGVSVTSIGVAGSASIAATFSVNGGNTLTVFKGGSGFGLVTSVPAGINCGTTCSATFASGTSVTLTAAASAGSVFSGWSGACTGSSPTCAVSMSAAQSVTAMFGLDPGYTLSVSKAGSGGGTVMSVPSGIMCGATCSASFPSGTVVTLVASPDAGVPFGGWSGACAGAASTCSVTMSAAKSVTATFGGTTPTWPLLVALAGTGSGSVTSSPSGINCGSTCSASYTNGTSVTLTAVPGAASTFTGWSGSCTGSTLTCTVSMTAARSATATFTAGTGVLSVTKSGTGTGVVTSSPAGINCGTTCSAVFASGAGVTLSAAANAGSTFAGWSGACSGSSLTCTISMTAAQSVSAAFTALPPYTLSVTKTGTGTGAVASSPTGINCGATCSAGFASGTSVVLAAVADAGSTFSGWSGACSGAGATCTVVMSAAKSVTASFTGPPPPGSSTLTISKLGSGAGTVLSVPSGINCGALCSANFTVGQVVTLVASPAAGVPFRGWSGGCTGTASVCSLTMSTSRSVTATFGEPITSYVLTVAKAGAGSGLVTSSPAGISCGSSCNSSSSSFNAGTSVTLTATPDSGFTFTGWSGACTGASTTCTLSMNTAANVTATFGAGPSYLLSVSKSGAGSGTVTSSPTGINCGATCSATYASGTSVSLTATAAAGSSFAGWTGACAGSAAVCVVSMTAAKSVNANFSLPPTFTLTALRSGSGAVTSSPAGINCGTTCSASVASGSSITLTAAPAAGWVFAGWTGACSGSAPTCVVTMSGPRAVVANFALVALGTAVDNVTLPWSTSSTTVTSQARPWIGQSSVVYSGGTAAASGLQTTDHSGTSVIRTTVTGPGTLSFYWKVSSESGWDWLTLQYDGWDQMAISGEIGWELQTWAIPAGTHEIRWTYSKDSNTSTGADTGWLDLVTFTPGATSVAPVSTANMTASPIRRSSSPPLPKI